MWQPDSDTYTNRTGKTGGTQEVSSLFAGWTWGASPKVKCHAASPRGQSRDGRRWRRWISSGQGPYNGSFLLCLLGPHNLLPCQQQASKGPPSSVAFQNHCKCLTLEQLAFSTHPNKQSWCWLRNSLTLFFLLLAFYSFSWRGEQERLSFVYSSWWFSPKMRLRFHFCLQFVSNTSPSILLLFLSLTLFSQYRITSSLVLWPGRRPTADSKNSRSVDGLSGVQFTFTLPVWNLHFHLCFFSFKFHFHLFVC